MNGYPSELEPGERDLDKELAKAATALALFGDPGPPIRLGRFEVVRGLGRGGMGAVYEARDSEQGSTIALKLLRRVGGRGVSELKREFRSLADVTHPNLVLLHELFIDQPYLFFTMELIDGVAFDTWLRRSRLAPNEPQFRSLIAQLAQAVNAIHTAGKLHGDIKPSNVMVTRGGRLVVLDFGLATEFDTTGEAARSNRVLAGTPAYMAPELADGTSTHRSSDWYAVGVMLFEALVARLPFEGQPARVMLAKREMHPPDPRELVPDLPADLCELCNALLQRDPDRRCSGNQVLRILGADRPAAIESLFHMAPSKAERLLGRESELENLAGSLEAARSGMTVLALVAGRSGVGKSALLDRFADDARKANALVLRGRCHDRESIPYNVFDSVLDALSQHLRELPHAELVPLMPRHFGALRQLFPGLHELPWGPAPPPVRAGGTLDARELRDQAFAALKELLHRLSRRHPIVMTVDDLQWGDTDSAHMAEHVFGPPNPPPLLFVGSCRSEEIDASAFMRAALRSHTYPLESWQLRRLELRPLERSAAVELARALLADRMQGAQAIAEIVADESEGDPLFITQLVQHVSTRAQGSQAPSASGAASLEQLIAIRMLSLPETAKALLRVLCVSSGPILRDVALDAASLSHGERSALLVLQVARLVRTRGSGSGQTIETYHDRIARILLRGLQTSVLRDVHACLARAIALQTPSDVERLVAHCLGAGDGPGAGAAAIQAAHAASQQLAFNRAAELFALAIELLPRADQIAAQLHRKLGQALANAGRGARAATAYLEASELATSTSVQNEMLAMAAKQFLRSGRLERGLELTRVVLARVGVELPRGRVGALSSFLWQRARLRIRGSRVSRPCHDCDGNARAERLGVLSDLSTELTWVEPLLGGVTQTLLLREALDAGDLPRAVKGLTWEAFNAALIGGPRNERRAARFLAEAQRLVERADTPHARGLILFADSARRLYGNRDFRDASVLGLQALELFSNECTGAFAERAAVTFIHSACLEWSGNLLELQERAAQVLREGEQRDDRLAALSALLSMPYACLVRDDPETALAFLDEHQAELGPGYTNFRHFWVIRRAETLLYMGAPCEALELLRANGWALRSSLLYQSEGIRYGVLHIRARCALAAHAQTGQPKLRSDAAKIIAKLQRARFAYGAQGSALAACLHIADGDRERAITALQRSVKGLCEAQADLLQLCPARILSELQGDAAEVARIDHGLRSQGVLNPQRWVRHYVPTCSSAQRGKQRT